jgi:hypothetical protein
VNNSYLVMNACMTETAAMKLSANVDESREQPASSRPSAISRSALGVERISLALRDGKTVSATSK